MTLPVYHFMLCYRALFERVSQGFTSYAGTSDALADLNCGHFPHPFDSHPPLEARLKALGIAMSDADYPGVLAGHGSAKHSLCLGDVVLGGDAFMTTVRQYYGRHLAMREYQSRHS